MSCGASQYLSRSNYITSQLHIPYECEGICDTANNFATQSDSIGSACLWCDSKCTQCVGPRDYQCTGCVSGSLSTTSAHLCGSSLINPSLATAPLSLTLPSTYSSEDFAYTLMFWVYADYSVSSQDLLLATPWQFSVSAANTVALTDQTTSLQVASIAMGSGWRHLALSSQPSPFGIQVAYEGTFVSLLAVPAAFRRITGLYLGNSGTSGRVNGYISDVYILNGSLRASMMSVLRRSVLDSGLLLDMTIGVSYLLSCCIRGTTMLSRPISLKGAICNHSLLNS